MVALAGSDPAVSIYLGVDPRRNAWKRRVRMSAEFDRHDGR